MITTATAGLGAGAAANLCNWIKTAGAQTLLCNFGGVVVGVAGALGIIGLAMLFGKDKAETTSDD